MYDYFILKWFVIVRDIWLACVQSSSSSAVVIAFVFVVD